MAFRFNGDGSFEAIVPRRKRRAAEMEVHGAPVQRLSGTNWELAPHVCALILALGLSIAFLLQTAGLEASLLEGMPEGLSLHQLAVLASLFLGAAVIACGVLHRVIRIDLEGIEWEALNGSGRVEWNDIEAIAIERGAIWTVFLARRRALRIETEDEVHLLTRPVSELVFDRMRFVFKARGFEVDRSGTPIGLILGFSAFYAGIAAGLFVLLG